MLIAAPSVTSQVAHLDGTPENAVIYRRARRRNYSLDVRIVDIKGHYIEDLISNLTRNVFAVIQYRQYIIDWYDMSLIL